MNKRIWYNQQLEKIRDTSVKARTDVTQAFVNRDMLGHYDFLGRDFGREMLDQALWAIKKQEAGAYLELHRLASESQ